MAKTSPAEQLLLDHAADVVDRFEPISDAALAESRLELLSRSAALSAAMRHQPDGGQAWRDYLEWGAVDALVDADAEPDLAALQASLAKLNSGAAGLELPVFRAAAVSLRRFIDQAALARGEDQTARYAEAVNAVPTLLAEIAAEPNEWRSYLLERRLALLSNLGQAAPLVTAARSGAAQPNVLLTVAEPMLQRLVRRPVTSSSPIRDRILGARVVGTGDTNGWLTVDVRPAHDAARLDFALSGAIHSRTTSYKGPIAVRSTANTPISAVKTVRLTPEAFYLLPSSASAKTRSRTRSIRKVGGGIGSRLIEKLASGRVAKDRPLADRISSGRAAGRVASGMDRRVEEAVRRLRRRYDDAWTKPLARYGAEPERFWLSTTEHTLEAALQQSGPGQFSASAPPPPGPAADAVARLHTTAVENLATPILGGATLSKAGPDEPVKISVKLPDWLDRVVEQQPGEGGDAEGFKPWKITLRRVRPLSVRFDEGAATVIVHTRRIQAGDEAYGGWDLIVKYAPQRGAGGWELVQQGEVDARRTRPDPRVGWSIRPRDRPVYSNLIDAVRQSGGIPDRVELPAIDLTEVGSGGGVQLVWQAIDFAGGWLAVGLDAI